MKLHKFFSFLAIITVWGIFAFPFLLQNKTPFPSKFQTSFFAPWNAYPELGGPVKNEAMPDVIGQIYPWRMFTVESWKNGFIPLWNPYSFSGTPHLANYQSAVFALQNIGFFIFPFKDWWTWLIILQPLLAGLFTFIYVSSLKQGQFSSLVSAVSFMFCGFIVTWMGYGTLAYAIIYLPLALFAIEKYFDKDYSRYLVLLSISIPLSFFSGHFQISTYFLLFVFAYILFKYLQTRKLIISIKLLIASLLGLMFTAPQLFPSIELYTQSFRSTIFAKTEVIPWAYLPSLVAPDFFGNPVTGNDWFGHYAEWNAYIGLIPLFFAFYSVLQKRKSYILFFMVISLVSILLAFPSPVLDFFIFLKIPVLSTSAASRIIVLFSFSASILSAFGIELFLKDLMEKKHRRIILCFGVFTLIFIALWGIVFFKLFLPVEKIAIARSNLMLPTLIFLGFSATIAGLIFLKRQRIKVFLLAVMLLVVSLDLLRFAYKWQPYDPKNLIFAPVNVTNYYPKIEDENRSFGNFGAEGMMYYNLLGVEGYDAVYIRRYGQFIASIADGRLTDSYRSVVAFPKNSKYTLKIANFLGIKYIIHKIADGENVWAFPFWKYDMKTIKLLFDDGHYQILENTNAFPRAFLVKNIIREAIPQKILDDMYNPKTNLRQTAVVEDYQGLNASGSGSAQITSYKPNAVVIKTVSYGNSFLVLTDTYYPGWKAFIDGKETKIYRTDFTFRGIEIPKGGHVVKFIYDPESFKYGIYIAIIGIAGVAFLVFLNSHKNKK